MFFFFNFLQLLSETFLIPRRTERDMIKMYADLHVQHPSLSSDFNETLIFWADFRKVLIKFHENSSSESQVVPCGRTGGQTDGWTGMTKLIVVFRNFANAPKVMTLPICVCACVRTMVSHSKGST